MTLVQHVRDRPAYVGSLALSMICIAALGALLVFERIGVEADPVVPPTIIAAIAVIFAVVAISIERR